MESVAHWIDSQVALETLCESLKQVPTIAVDTEFIRETTFFPRIALIQVASDKECWLVDPLAFSPDELQPLIEILVDEKILKVMHAAGGDQECFYHEYGIVVSPVLDTAAAAALCGYGDNIGLARLVKLTVGKNLAKGRSRVHWLKRPLAKELFTYAAEDVKYLVAAAQKILSETESLGRTHWAMEISRPRENMINDSPETFARRMVGGTVLDLPTAGALFELVVWRETRARDADRPRGWIADNSVLTSLARSRPKTLEELSHFRGLNPKEIQKSGDAILGAIENGQNRRQLETADFSAAPSADEELAVGLLKAFVNVLSSKHRIASRYLISSDNLLPLFRTRSAGPGAWKPFLHPEALKLVGEEIEAFLNGKSALGLDDGKLMIIER